MHRFRIAGNKIVPPVEILAITHQRIGAGGRQPADLMDLLEVQLDTIRHGGAAVFVVGASTALAIEQHTADRGERHFAGVPVLQLVETAEATAVAQAFPFLTGHLGQRFGFPERRVIHR
jgi:hypothetical protein